MDPTTGISLVVKRPDAAYVSNMLWLPKELVRVDAVKASLQYWDVKKGSPVLMTFWEETENHLVIPREFISTDQYRNYGFPFYDLTPRHFARSGIESKISLRNQEQVTAWESLREARGGILNLACGKGKTVLALKRIADLGVPSLIVVNNGVQLAHWKGEIERFLELPAGEKIGLFQGKNEDWKRPITIATIQTLSKKAEDGTLPAGFGAWFGSVWFDEVHHLSAPWFAKAAPLVSGLRFGLTATANRLDQRQWVYNYHLGGIFYTDLEQPLIPEVFFQQTNVVIDENSKEARDKAGNPSIPRLRSLLGEDELSLRVREFCVREALDAGRKILCLSHSKQMLLNLSERFPGSACVTGDTPNERRISDVVESRLAFAIDELGTECLSDSALDALFILTPLSSPNDLQQMLGRVQRIHPNKKPPIVIILDDKNIEGFRGLIYQLKAHLRGWRMDYSDLPAPNV
jgi:superfamily II DNA or RNA helicase